MTISELIVVMAISGTLWGISTVALVKPQQKANIDRVVNTLVADIKSQQTKAMSGDLSSDYKIHFEENSYTLDNFTVSLGDNVKIDNIAFNNHDLIFEKGSGEVSFVTGQNSLNISNDNGDEIVNISINKYGTVQTN